MLIKTSLFLLFYFAAPDSQLETPADADTDSVLGFHVAVSPGLGHSRTLGWGVCGAMVLGEWSSSGGAYGYEGLMLQMEKGQRGHRVSVGYRRGASYGQHRLHGYGLGAAWRSSPSMRAFCPTASVYARLSSAPRFKCPFR